MSKFIEITIVNGGKELINTDAIESVSYHEGKTVISYSNFSRNAHTVKIEESYTEIKSQLL